MKTYSSFMGNIKTIEQDFFEKIDPVTQKVVYRCAVAHEEAMEIAIKMAQESSLIWRKKTLKERSDVLLEIASLLQAYKKELCDLDCLDTGRPISELMSVDVDSSIENLQYFAKESVYSTLLPQMEYHEDYNLEKTHHPYGICLGLGAFNYPLQVACWKLAPAFIAGNSMIFCPSDHTPRSALLLAELINKTSAPEGLFSVLLGGRRVAPKLVEDGRISHISLTGSVPTAQKIIAASSKHLKKTVMELGGKSPLLILKDAHVEEAVKGALMANFYSQGEICSNATRVYVHESIYDSFRSLLVEKMKSIRLGDPFCEKTQMGPLISSEHTAHVLSIIKEGLKNEGKSFQAGEVRGNYFPPMLIEDVDDDNLIAQEELFAPVLCLFSFKSEEEVIHRANKTLYGLSAGIFSQNIEHAQKVMLQLDAGSCWINNYNVTPVGMAFGGTKMSGRGRENAQEALSDYSWMKTTYIEKKKVDCPYF